MFGGLATSTSARSGGDGSPRVARLVAARGSRALPRPARARRSCPAHRELQYRPPLSPSASFLRRLRPGFIGPHPGHDGEQASRAVPSWFAGGLSVVRRAAATPERVHRVTCDLSL